MAVILHEHLHEPGEWGLWHIIESEKWLMDNVALFPAEINHLMGVTEFRLQKNEGWFSLYRGVLQRECA